MAEEKRVETTTLTFDYFKVCKGGTIARRVHTEVVEVFGFNPEQCFVETEDGDLDLDPTLAKKVYSAIKHERHCKETDYHTISRRGSDRPAWWFNHEDEEESEEDE